MEDIYTLELGDNGHFQRVDGTQFAVPVQGLPTMEFYRQQIVLGLRDYAPPLVSSRS
ncbi:hypothetical protein J4711_13695 [Staphylococcus epidermidis]|nr:hypothetical protein [Staphylococcus epidermidis]